MSGTSEDNEPGSFVERDAPLTLWRGHPELGHELAQKLPNLGPKYEDALSAIAMALARQALKDGRSVSYPRRAAAYSKLPHRYRNPLFTRRKIIPVIDALAQEGLIEHLKAPPGQLGWQSSMRANQELMKIALPHLGGKIVLWMPPSTIKLKDTNGALIDYRDTALTYRMQRDLDAQNEALMSVDFGHHTLSKTFLFRIFNNGRFDEGGRFYVPGESYQTLSKDERRKLLIDGEPAVEIDYGQLHAALAYMSVGATPIERAYDIPGFPRQLVKVAFNVVLNCDSPQAARSSIAQKDLMLTHLCSEIPLSDGSPKRLCHIARLKDPNLHQRALAEAEKLITAVEQKHNPIAKMFYTRIGIKFQRIDSDMAACVMRAMRKRGVAVAPIHDSFLVPRSEADHLEEEMMRAAEMKRVQVFCKRS